MAEKNPGELKLEDQRRRAQQGPSLKKKKTPKAGIGNLPGKKKQNFIIAIDDKFISNPNKSICKLRFNI